MAAKKKKAVAKVGKRSSPARSAKTQPQAKVAKASPAALPAKKAKAPPVVKTSSAQAPGKAGSVTKGVSKGASKGAGKAVTKAASPVATGLTVGDRAPAINLVDQAGGSVSSDDLAGTPYVIYFYPKDDTPGCTTEACGFRDAFPDFERIGVRVIGVSPDSVTTHQRFVAKYGLPFTLLSDGGQELASAYGVWGLKKNYGREYMGIVRSTFLVDRAGVIRKVWRAVRVNGHVAEVQAAAAGLASA
jgi:peroxiredoxin Q/BCP